MVMVGTDALEVERSLVSGELACPSCSAVLAPWGHARSRSSRGPAGTVRHRPRRARCTGCRGTHVLLAHVWLCRRADAVSVIGAALEAKAAGAGHRRVATVLGRPAGTVRGWLRRFASRAEQVRARFTRLLLALDPLAAPVTPRATALGDALEAIGRAAAAATLRLAPTPPWELAARATGGRLLAPARPGGVSNTS